MPAYLYIIALTANTGGTPDHLYAHVQSSLVHLVESRDNARYRKKVPRYRLPTMESAQDQVFNLNTVTLLG